MNKKEALVKINKLVGHDLVSMAHKNKITIFTDKNTLNKGWAGLALEKEIGLTNNSIQAPDGDDFELKLVPLKKSGNTYTPKETMAITMINEKNILSTNFEESHLYNKLKNLIICGRVYEDRSEKKSTLVSVGVWDLLDIDIKNQIRDDYEKTRTQIVNFGFNSLSGKIGVYIQPRTKGKGHGSKTRAFYARKKLVKTILNIV